MKHSENQLTASSMMETRGINNKLPEIKKDEVLNVQIKFRDRLDKSSTGPAKDLLSQKPSSELDKSKKRK